jgi:hypothetical protein
MMIFTKTPDETKDFSLDWFKDIATDVIPSSGNSTWSISPAGPTITASSIGTSPSQGALAGTLTTVWISGGVVGQVYQVQNKIVTTASRTLTKVARLLVESGNLL